MSIKTVEEREEFQTYLINRGVSQKKHSTLYQYMKYFTRLPYPINNKNVTEFISREPKSKLPLVKAITKHWCFYNQQKDRQIDYNVSLLEQYKQPRRKKLPKYITKKEYKLMFKAIEHVFDESIRQVYWKLIISLLYYGGCRVSEMLKVRMENMKLLADNYLSITLTETKGDKDRIVNLPPQITKIILDNKPNRTGYMFPNRIQGHNKPVSRQYVDRILKLIGVKAGVKIYTDELGLMNSRVSAHQFRHGCAMRLFRLGWKQKFISKYLGHVNTATTDIYLTLDGGEVLDKFRETH